ncbi:hypothetical protein E2C01_063095 [Portunus trituberculatus]|uniref:Uncharacterized protein n=1 Tax=Portunus trituberculatus TaxID=210409 RepID=A0A5B7HH71_PORTR|nr:hypothetical protein [Portunus trituberculatus]
MMIFSTCLETLLTSRQHVLEIYVHKENVLYVEGRLRTQRHTDTPQTTF